MKNCIDKLFYSIYIRVGKQYGGTEFTIGPAILATILLSIMSLSIVISIVFVLKYWFEILHFTVFPTWLFYGIAAIIMLLNYFLFVYRKRYLKIAERYKSLDERRKKQTTLPWFLLFVLNSLSLPIVGYIYLLFMQ